MTPKQKAKELILRYYFVYVSGYTSIHEVKRAALIAVDEILNDYSYMQNVRNANSNQIHSQRVYWQEVKSEIEKL